MSLGYAHLNVVEALPVSRFAPEGAEHVCRRLRGQRFTALEVPTYDVKIEGGGLLIDYKTVGDRAARLILGFNENGIWVQYDSLAPVGANFQDDGPQDAGRSLKMNLVGLFEDDIAPLGTPSCLREEPRSESAGPARAQSRLRGVPETGPPCHDEAVQYPAHAGGLPLRADARARISTR